MPKKHQVQIESFELRKETTAVLEAAIIINSIIFLLDLG